MDIVKMRYSIEPRDLTVKPGDLTGNKIADNITSVSKKPSKNLHNEALHSNKANNEIPKEIYIYL